MVWVTIHHVLALISLPWLLTTAAAVSEPNFAVARPGCSDRCGDVEIPFPFGIGKGCYMNDWFAVTCYRIGASDIPKPYLNFPSTQVLNISVPAKTLRVNTRAAVACTSSSTTTTATATATASLENNPHLFFSERSNRFTVVGRDVNGTITGNGQRIWGCIATCNDQINISFPVRDDPVNFPTFSGGCYGGCQVYLPFGLNNFTIDVQGSDCKWAALIDQNSFSADQSSGWNAISSPTVPTVIDWKFLAAASKQNKDNMIRGLCQVCGPNSVCSIDNGAASCSCPLGFYGNPYLGCLDSDECMNPNTNQCVNLCINTLGGYICRCPSGYHGDGRKDGGGCSSTRPWLTPLIISSSTGAGVLFLVTLIWWSCKFHKRNRTIKMKQRFFKRNGGLVLQQKLSLNTANIEQSRFFTAEELEVSTDWYNERRILGQGGQGTVYKGMLIDGRIVAVKKSKVIDERQIEQFINEVVILSQIDHRNIVKLLGCCLETEVPILVYEFIPNGTLYHVLHDQSEEFPLSWEMRLRIAAEVVSAISYLHSSASVPIYHRDIKTTNILLDEKFRAKVSDFGTSKSIGIDQTHLTTQVKGTFGYLDPEYFRSGKFTERSDVYSFGVVLVELLTGQRPISATESQEARGLVAYFISSMEGSRLSDILDARVAKEAEWDNVLAVACLADHCLSLKGSDRPSMKEVAQQLEAIRGSNLVLHIHHNQVEIDATEAAEQAEWEFTTSSEGTDMDSNSSSSLNVQPFIFKTI